MADAYSGTEVPVVRSQTAILELLRGYRCQRMSFAESREGDTVRVGVEFVHRDHLVRLVVPLKPPSPQELNNKIRAARTKTPEQVKEAMEDQEAKRVWRVLFHSLKARLVSIDSGLETFEQAFLPHIVDPATDHTIWERIAPRVEAGALRIGGVGLALPAASESPKSARVVDIRPSEGGR